MSKSIIKTAQALTIALQNTTEKVTIKGHTAYLEHFGKFWFLHIDGDTAMVAGLNENLNWAEVQSALEMYLQV